MLASADQAVAANYKLALEYVQDRKQLQEWQRYFVSSLWAGCLPAERKFFPADFSYAKRCLAQTYSEQLFDYMQIMRGLPTRTGQVFR